jgi:hypothetical protein
VSSPRFNHMELTLPKGALSANRCDIAEFYSDLFAWEAVDVPILKQNGLLLRTDPETSQFILLTEQHKHMSSPGYDHLGLLYDTRGEVDARLEKARKWRERDDRVEIKEYEDLDAGSLTVHAFYVRFLLPIWFDVQAIEHAEGAEPAKRWNYA